MTEKQAIAMKLRKQGMTYNEIGEHMGISRAAAYNLVTRGLASPQLRSVAGMAERADCKYPGIQARLGELCMTQKRLADLCGIDASSICNYLVGRREPRLTTARRIADVLGLTLDEAFEEAE